VRQRPAPAAAAPAHAALLAAASSSRPAAGCCSPHQLHLVLLVALGALLRLVGAEALQPVLPRAVALLAQLLALLLGLLGPHHLPLLAVAAAARCQPSGKPVLQA
jgi:hypothetical protein